MANLSRRAMLRSVPALAIAGTVPSEEGARESVKLLALGDEHSRALLAIASYVESLGEEDIPDGYTFPDDEVAQRMVHAPALSIVGLGIKARAYVHTAAIVDRLNPEIPTPKDDWSIEEQLLFSLLRDVLALSRTNV